VGNDSNQGDPIFADENDAAIALWEGTMTAVHLPNTLLLTSIWFYGRDCNSVMICYYSV
jgi:hypothetical protein